MPEKCIVHTWMLSHQVDAMNYEEKLIQHRISASDVNVEEKVQLLNDINEWMQDWGLMFLSGCRLVQSYYACTKKYI